MTRDRDFSNFLSVLWRSEKPSYIPLYEHIASSGFISRATNTKFYAMGPDTPGYWKIYVDFWLGLGFDCIPMEVPLRCRLKGSEAGSLSNTSEAHAVITNMEEYEKYPWPSVSDPINFKYFEEVASLIPDNIKIVAGVGMGPFEWVSQMMGLMGLSYALIDDPALPELMFERIRELIVSADRQLATMDAVGALRQGDDLGFNSSTFLSPTQLRKLVFPTYKQMASIAHENGKPFILHSCGNLKDIYDDLIEDCRIDAKHSFEDKILPVDEFKRLYGNRITPLGGLDVDVICRSTPDDLRSYTRKMVEQCFSDGYWALGTGNSLTDYMPVENYLTVIDEARKIS